MSAKTCLMIGGSGRAGHWIRAFVDRFSDRVNIIGLVDVNPEVLETQRAGAWSEKKPAVY